MYGLYSTDIRAILNRCNFLHVTPYEEQKGRFVQITSREYRKKFNYLVYFKWAHLFVMTLSLYQTVKSEGIGIKLLSFGIGGFFLNTSYVGALYGRQSSVRDIVALLNTLVKFDRDEIMLNYIQRTLFTKLLYKIWSF
jgi:hypothetical protein